MVALLGPETGLQRRNGLTNTTMAGTDVAFGEEVSGTDEAGAVLNGVIGIRADKLSCARVLLVASRAFSMLKIEAVANDVLSFSRQLG